MLTDPYGKLEYGLGGPDDFVCFDYHVDRKRKRVLLHATLNSETSHSIADFCKPEWENAIEAVSALRSLVDRSIEWALENRVRLNLKHWGQDPYYVVRCLRHELAGDGTPPTRRLVGWRKSEYGDGIGR